MKTAIGLGLAGLAAFAGVAEASHFRYGTLRWKESKEQPDNANKWRVSFTTELAFRRSWLDQFGQGTQHTDPMDYTWGDALTAGNTVNFNDYYFIEAGDGGKRKIDAFLVTVSDPDQDVFMGFFSGDYDYNRFGGPYTAVYTHCCRLKAQDDPTRGTDEWLNNNGNGHWHLSTKVDILAAGYRSPTSSYVPIVQVGNSGWQEIQMVALPPENDVSELIWSLADENRMGKPGHQAEGKSGVQPASASKYYIGESDGVIMFDTTDAEPGFYCTQVLVSGVNSPDIQTPIDFFILVAPPSAHCVNDCDNSGTECTVDAVGVEDPLTQEMVYHPPCAGSCVNMTDPVHLDALNATQTPGAEFAYDACQPNTLPKVIAPTFINILSTDPEDVDFEVTFEPNPYHEQYQNLTMYTGTVPPNTQFTFDNGPFDTGKGRVFMDKQFTSTPNQFAICFVAYDGIGYGEPTCTTINIMEPLCNSMDKNMCRHDSKFDCRWDNTKGECYKVPACTNYNKYECTKLWNSKCKWVQHHEEGRKLLGRGGGYGKHTSFSLARPHLSQPFVAAAEQPVPANKKGEPVNYKDGEWEPFFSCEQLTAEDAPDP